MTTSRSTFIQLALGVCLSLVAVDGLANNKSCIKLDQLTTDGSDFIVKSLHRSFHGGNRIPGVRIDVLCQTPAQLGRAKRRYLTMSTPDRQALNKRFQDQALRLVALRDSDADGVLDFRVKELGSFLPNDPDVDGDGISNLLDPRPLDPDPERDSLARNDADGDSLPDHLDWSNTKAYWPRKSSRLVFLQRRIYQRFGIMLVETPGVTFSETLAEMTLDILSVFNTYYRSGDMASAVESITFSDQYGVDPYGVLAEVSPVNGQVLIYEYGTKEIAGDPQNLIAPFMVFVHEFAHVVQNAMDFPHNQPDLLTLNTHSRPNRFVRTLNKLGWDLHTPPNHPVTAGAGFIEHGNEAITIEQVYRGVPLSQIHNLCEDDWANWNEENWREFNVVMCYSLLDAREWHAEYIATTVLTRMFERLRQTHGGEALTLIERAQNKMYADWNGESYDYKNADQSAVRELSKTLRLSNRLLDRLNRKYILKPFGNTPLPVADLVSEAQR